MTNEEQVLIFPSKCVEGWPDGAHLFDRGSGRRFVVDILSNTAFIDRSKAENDLGLKQIIPYIMLESCDWRYLCYRRTKQGGETRLHGKASIGIGGHISREDATKGWRPDGGMIVPDQMLINCAKRELEEELGIVPRLMNPIGYIIDDRTPVGQVHFGVVYRSLVSDNMIKKVKPGPEISQTNWLTIQELAKVDNMESWSEMCLELLIRKSLLRS
jgi:predicted NUDIX family phosphoesterase